MTTWTKRTSAANTYTNTTTATPLCSTEGPWFSVEGWFQLPWFWSKLDKWTAEAVRSTSWTSVASATVPTWTKPSTATNIWS